MVTHDNDTPSATDIADAVRRGERSAVEVLELYLHRIDQGQDVVNAFIEVDPDGARAQARAVDDAVAAGQDPGPLAGVPMGVKDCEDVMGMRTRRGSLLFADHPPATVDGLHVSRLRAAGAVMVGKTTMPEFGFGSDTVTRISGVTRNPWNPDRTSGGSSGGSAAAVAAGMVPLATAGDGGGSTRIPGAFCGLVGLKPTYGRIPRPHQSESQTDVYGVMATTVADAARHLDVAAGPDDRDRTSLPPPPSRYEDAMERLEVAGLRAVWSPDMGFAAVDPEVRELAGAAALEIIQAAGLTEVDHQLRFSEPLKLWLAAGSMDLWIELERGMWPERAADVTGLTRWALENTETYPVSRFARVHKRRMRFQHEMAELFEHVDLVFTPTTAVAAYAAEGPTPTVIDGEEVFPGLATPFTMPANLAWNAAVSLPAGVTSEGLPVGVQITGRRFGEDVLVRLARIWEQTRPWPRVAPGWPRPG